MPYRGVAPSFIYKIDHIFPRTGDFKSSGKKYTLESEKTKLIVYSNCETKFNIKLWRMSQDEDIIKTIEPWEIKPKMNMICLCRYRMTEDIGSVSSTVTITAWAVAILILVLVIATCCKCFSPCATVGSAVWDLLKCIFGGLWTLCKCFAGMKESEPKEVKESKRKLAEKPSMRKRFRRDDSRLGLEKSASVSKASMDTVSVGLDGIGRVIDWSIRYEKDRVMITSVLNGVEVYFNPWLGRVEDVTGKRHLVSMPDISILTVAEDIRRLIRPPELVETEGLRRVRTDRSVYVDPTDNKFRKSTGDLAPGYVDLV